MRLRFRKETASLILLAIMVLSGLGVYVGNQDETATTYNGYQFFPQPSGWLVRINNAQYQFQYLPTDTNFSIGTIPLGEKVYIAYDPLEKNITTENIIAQTSALFRQFGVWPVVACVREEGCPADLPLVACETAPAPVFYFRSAEERGVVHQGQCIIIQAQTSIDLHRAVERMAYQLLGVMKNE
ncbi:hypothetical protein HY639_01115 [Candidatus Woesearchaeota archaeon]|nr:hypothetical protein [Candidatus Woesearchaeota archaeon]